MPTYLSPGVYVEEVSSGSSPIEGVGTAVAAFVGLAAKGPANAPTLVTNWTQFTADVRRLRRGLVPRARRVRLLPQRRRRGYVVRIGARRRRRRRRPRARELAAQATSKAGRAIASTALEGGPGRQRHHASRSPTPARPAERHVQADRQARRQGRGDVRQRHAPSAARTTSSTVVKAQSKLIQLEEIGSARRARACPSAARSALAGGDGRRRRCASPPDDYVGDSADRTGFGGLEAIDEVTMLARARPDGRATSAA